jgi:hypothetical protein
LLFPLPSSLPEGLDNLNVKIPDFLYKQTEALAVKENISLE